MMPPSGRGQLSGSMANPLGGQLRLCGHRAMRLGVGRSRIHQALVAIRTHMHAATHVHRRHVHGRVHLRRH